MTNTLTAVLLSATTALLITSVWAQGQVTAARAGPRQGTVYEASPSQETPSWSGGGSSGATTSAARATAARIVPGTSSSAAAESGPGVEIISGGGGGSDGAAKVGHLPVLQ